MKLEKFEKSLKVGQRCNVRRQHGKLMRVVTKVERRIRDGAEWLYWYWEPEHSSDLGNYHQHDCGYAGVRLANP